MTEQHDDVMQMLRSIAVPDEEIEHAAKEGRGALIALFADRAFVPGVERLNRHEVAERAGVEDEQAAELWRALGFPDAADDDRVFTEADAEVLQRAALLMSTGVIDSDVALQMARVIGRATAQIAAAQVDVATQHVDPGSDALPPLLAQTPILLHDLERWIVHIWRRHFAAEVKRAALQFESGEAGNSVVGFADLVGFTGASQEMDTEELAHAVSTFESIAVEIVGRHSGRVVKMIGDEAMFEAPDALSGVHIALDIADAVSVDDHLPDIRVGLAAGPALRSEGDIFGTAPNLASRLVDQAYPSSVLVSDSIHDALSEVPELEFKPVRPRNLKGFGRTKLWVARRAGEEPKRSNWKLLQKLPMDLVELADLPFMERDDEARSAGAAKRRERRQSRE